MNFHSKTMVLVDCLDQSDESMCDKCGNDTIYCGENKCMSSEHVCDGEVR